MAPEIAMGERYSGPAADIFAAGISLFMMIFRRVPFNQASKVDDIYKLLAFN